MRLSDGRQMKLHTVKNRETADTGRNPGRGKGENATFFLTALRSQQAGGMISNI